MRRSTISAAIALALIGQIYDAATDPERWPEFLSAFAHAVKGQGTVIFAHNVETMEAATAFDSARPAGAVNFEGRYLESLAEHYNFVNVWARNEHVLKPGRVVTGSMLYPVKELPDTEFYNDWLRPQDLFYAVGGLIVQDGPWATKFSCLRSRRVGDYTPEELRLYEELLPHLARATHIQRRFAFLQNLSSSSLAVLDSVDAGVMLLDASSRVLHVNATAEAELRRADPLIVNRVGELRIRGSARGQSALRDIVAASLRSDLIGRGNAATTAQLWRRNGESLFLQAVPLPERNRPMAVATLSGRLAACALIIGRVGSLFSKVRSQFLSSLYGLTPAEGRAAALVAKGMSVAQAADELGVSRNTVKSQLRCVYSKTGVRRQGELVRLWMSGKGEA